MHSQIADRAVSEVRPWVSPLAHLGMAAKGVVYLVVGGMAARVALLGRGRLGDQRDALIEVFRQPLGTLALGAVGVGLLGYVMWRLVEGILDPEHEGTKPKALAKRAGSIASGLLHSGLAIFALRLAAGSRDKGGGGEELGRSTAAGLLHETWGRWLLLAVAAGIIGRALYELYRAFSGKFMDKLRRAEMSHREQLWANRLGRIGMTARAIVFAVIGGFVLKAVRLADARQIDGVDGALRQIASGRWGIELLAVVAIGLVIYGIYMIAIEARYRRVTPP